MQIALVLFLIVTASIGNGMLFDLPIAATIIVLVALAALVMKESAATLGWAELERQREDEQSYAKTAKESAVLSSASLILLIAFPLLPWLLACIAAAGAMPILSLPKLLLWLESAGMGLYISLLLYPAANPNKSPSGTGRTNELSILLPPILLCVLMLGVNVLVLAMTLNTTARFIALIYGAVCVLLIAFFVFRAA